MPYKNKEDRTEAVRRHRENKRIDEENKKWVGDFLTEICNFKTKSFRDLVEVIQEEFIVEEDGIRLRSTGELVSEPDVYSGLNMCIIVDTIHVTNNA